MNSGATARRTYSPFFNLRDRSKSVLNSTALCGLHRIGLSSFCSSNTEKLAQRTNFLGSGPGTRSGLPSLFHQIVKIQIQFRYPFFAHGLCGTIRPRIYSLSTTLGVLNSARVSVFIKWGECKKRNRCVVVVGRGKSVVTVVVDYEFSVGNVAARSMLIYAGVACGKHVIVKAGFVK